MISLQFKNEPNLDFSKLEIRAKLEKEIEEVKKNLGTTIGPIVNGLESCFTDEVFKRENPANLKEFVVKVYCASRKHVNDAIQFALKAQPYWADKSLEERAEILLNAASILRAKRMFFIALMLFEQGKSRQEADGEASEAIDFLEYYAKTAMWIEQLDNNNLVQIPGEVNERKFLPLGVGASIQPWNFPLAISCGPAAAALVMGNAVLYKPAKESSLVGYHLTQVFYQAGVPKAVFAFLPGSGKDIGSYLVEHPDVDFVAFTGSKAVGVYIEDFIAKYNHVILPKFLPRHRIKKRVSALELGGKAAIIIDEDADLDEAVLGVSSSAFGFQGQKCSACTRVIILESIYEEFISRLAQRVRELEIGPPLDPKNLVGPLISQKAYEKVMQFREVALKEGSVIAEGVVPDKLKGNGYYVAPLLVGDLDENGRVAQEEIFGPILSVFKVKDFKQALAVANNTEYGLVGGLYSRNFKHIEEVKKNFDVGNLYINRKITGAMVARQPFGGVKMSGNGVQAGAWDYLFSFIQRKSICENITRRGYATILKKS